MRALLLFVGLLPCGLRFLPLQNPVDGTAKADQAFAGLPGDTGTVVEAAGVAPESQIVIQSIGDGSGFVDAGLTLSTLFQPTYDLGARVHSDSWGSPVHGVYTSYSQQIDDFVNTHRDFVLVFPTGLNLTGPSSPGQRAWLTRSSPLRQGFDGGCGQLPKQAF